MRARVATALVALLAPSAAWAWGDQAHVFIAEAAYNNLTDSCLAAMYFDNDRRLLQSAVDPDDWRDTDPNEGPRHFLDIDAIPNPADFPHDLNVAIQTFGRSAVYANGTVPWVVESYYAQLVDAFRSENVVRIVEISGNLSHYVSDSHSPYHATINFDGQETGNPGIHGRYETDMVDANANAVRSGINARTMHVPAPPVMVDAIFTALETGTVLVAGINTVDVQSRGSIPALWSAKGAEAMERMAAGASLTTALWQAAYAEAGSPLLAGMPAGCGVVAMPDAGFAEPDAGAMEPPDAGAMEPPDAGQPEAQDAQASVDSEAPDGGSGGNGGGGNKRSSSCESTDLGGSAWAGLVALGLGLLRLRRWR